MWPKCCARGSTEPPNKGMKLTSAERIGRSQLIRRVVRTMLERREHGRLEVTPA
jgi:hypothetical protein